MDLEDALFHCQQAVEKAFKAFLTWPAPGASLLPGTQTALLAHV
jgi:hypothetical protein